MFQALHLVAEYLISAELVCKQNAITSRYILFLAIRVQLGKMSTLAWRVMQRKFTDVSK
jgi:hypothetical protein